LDLPAQPDHLECLECPDQKDTEDFREDLALMASRDVMAKRDLQDPQDLLVLQAQAAREALPVNEVAMALLDLLVLEETMDCRVPLAHPDLSAHLDPLAFPALVDRRLTEVR